MDWVCIHKMVHTHRKGSMIYYYILEIHLQDPHQISPTKNSTLMSDGIRIKKKSRTRHPTNCPLSILSWTSLPIYKEGFKIHHASCCMHTYTSGNPNFGDRITLTKNLTLANDLVKEIRPKNQSPSSLIPILDISSHKQVLVRCKRI